MTPAARLSAAMQILDRILAGSPAEQALINWARASRFAGSGDRNAIRDLVFDALRCRRSYAALGGGETGRGLILGGLRATGQDPVPLFTGEGHAPAPLRDTDTGHSPDAAAATDLPDWLVSQLRTDLGADFAAIAEAMRHRAPVFLRVNIARATPDSAMAMLADEGIDTEPHPLSPTALQVVEGARKIAASTAFADGVVELQDAASQAVIDALPLRDGIRVLDYCAGGGGKTLAMAARARLKLFAHDADSRRMRDLPARARRAGAKVTLIDAPKGPYDLVLTDVPCSGSGSWRRAPEGKWLLTEARLAALLQVQAEILDHAARLVAPGGVLAYATCSLLAAENGAQITAFQARQGGWDLVQQRRLTPLDGGDGFFVAVLRRSTKD
ncbi:RsmB/NOP family class I SAM-dependent RNA methyltransferase [Gemmobacter serpentinus]|uniref:RsmB/NOP family class I SAM-dependent RNA methyltransferase n=1 Tax=Gemmobacter serpentinus TaxID=2652247 RepID=UPI00124C7BAB|nr:RsmB/NOP family class I SAM-dependent RNA methyltransferase [Gemmobacter serpentinus]